MTEVTRMRHCHFHFSVLSAVRPLRGAGSTLLLPFAAGFLDITGAVSTSDEHCKLVDVGYGLSPDPCAHGDIQAPVCFRHLFPCVEKAETVDVA